MVRSDYMVALKLALVSVADSFVNVVGLGQVRLGYSMHPGVNHILQKLVSTAMVVAEDGRGVLHGKTVAHRLLPERIPC